MSVRSFQAATPPRFVRVRSTRPNGLVEFDFIVGDGDLTVELILPRPAFEEFCAREHALPLPEHEGAAIDRDRSKWQYGSPGVTD